MAKERTILAFIAIVAGVILASSIFYFYQKKSVIKETAQPQIAPTSQVSNGKVTLDIESPQDELATDKKTIVVNGKTSASALVVLTTNTDDLILKANDDGTFSKTVTLADNENLISITAYTDTGTSDTKELIVTYTTEEF